MGGKETIECQINCFSINHFYKTADNQVIIEFLLHLADLTFNNFNWFNALDHYCILSAKLVCTACYIYTDLFTLNSKYIFNGFDNIISLISVFRFESNVWHIKELESIFNLEDWVGKP